jgi:hypothetical protein
MQLASGITRGTFPQLGKDNHGHPRTSTDNPLKPQIWSDLVSGQDQLPAQGVQLDFGMTGVVLPPRRTASLAL